MNGEPIMSREIQKLGVELQFGTPFKDYALEVVVSMPVSHSTDLPIGLDMALEEKLQALPWIEPDKEISGVSQDHDKPISHSPGETLLHPVHLSLLSRDKGQLMISLSLLLTVLLGPNRDRGVTAFKFITPEPVVDLRGL